MEKSTAKLTRSQILDDFESKWESTEIKWQNLMNYASELIEQEDDFIDVLIKKRKHMEVTWNVPHYQTIGSRVVKEDTKLSGFKKGKITSDESDLMDKNWEMFTQSLNIDSNPEFFARWKNREKYRKLSRLEDVRGLVTIFLARGLQRTLHQVYNHFVAKHAYPSKGQYTKKEMKIIQFFFQNDPEGRKVTSLSRILGREPRGLYKLRVRPESWIKPDMDKVSGVSRPPTKKIQHSWNLDLTRKLIKSILLRSGLDLPELFNNKIPYNVWKEVEKDMNMKCDKLQLIWFRKIHVQVFTEKPVKILKTVKRFLKVIKFLKFPFWRDIRWDEVLEYFPIGFTKEFLQYKLGLIIGKVVPQFYNKPLKKVVKKMLAHDPTSWPKATRVLNPITLQNLGKEEDESVENNESQLPQKVEQDPKLFVRSKNKESPKKKKQKPKKVISQEENCSESSMLCNASEESFKLQFSPEDFRYQLYLGETSEENNIQTTPKRKRRKSEKKGSQKKRRENKGINTNSEESQETENSSECSMLCNAPEDPLKLTLYSPFDSKNLCYPEVTLGETSVQTHYNPVITSASERLPNANEASSKLSVYSPDNRENRLKVPSSAGQSNIKVSQKKRKKKKNMNQNSEDILAEASEIIDKMSSKKENSYSDAKEDDKKQLVRRNLSETFLLNIEVPDDLNIPDTAHSERCGEPLPLLSENTQDFNFATPIKNHIFFTNSAFETPSNSPPSEKQNGEKYCFIESQILFSESEISVTSGSSKKSEKRRKKFRDLRRHSLL